MEDGQAIAWGSSTGHDGRAWLKYFFGASFGEIPMAGKTQTSERRITPFKVGLNALWLLVVLWLVVGTHWFVWDKTQFLKDLEVKLTPEKAACIASLDFTRLPAMPYRVAVVGDAGRELEMVNGHVTCPLTGSSGTAAFRASFKGALGKPTHVEVTLTYQDCRATTIGMSSLPLLPF